MANTAAIDAALADPCPPDGPKVVFAVAQVREQKRRVRKDKDGNDVEMRPFIAIGLVHETIELPEKNSYSTERNKAMVPADGAVKDDVMAFDKIADVIPAREVARLVKEGAVEIVTGKPAKVKK
jgi:hypothetical protein